jgi:general secretion pathway protein G
VRDDVAHGGTIEPMIILVVAGIVVGLMAGPLRIDREARDVARAQMSLIGQAIEMYELEHRRLPHSLEDLTREDGRSGIAYMHAIPKDPWGNDFDYRLPDRRKYVIVSAGRNGVLDDEDDLRYARGERR